MPIIPESKVIGKCIYREDKNLLIRIIDNVVEAESRELRTIEEKKKEFIEKPEDLKRYLKVKAFQTLQHTTFKNNIEKLKVKIENTPYC